MKSEVIRGRDPSTGGTLRVEYAGRRIVAVDRGLPLGPEEGYLAPGLIDLQVNGYAGYDLNAPGLTINTVLSLVNAMLARGVTTFLPTLITAPPEQIEASLAVIAEARRTNSAAAHAMPFVHLEGPWIGADEGTRGAHPRQYVTAPDLNQLRVWQQASDHLIGLVTLSPHFENSVATVATLTQQGILVAIGHTNATPTQIREAVDAGARLSTHLGNGAAAMLARHPNFLWAQLAEDRLMACFIADGHHLPADTFTAMLRAKGIQRSILVSDVTAAGGLPPGAYNHSIGGRVELSPDGRLSLAGTPYLAGAALSLPEVVARAIDLGGIDLATALQLATLNPGSLLGGRGKLAVGETADILRFHWHPGSSSLEIETVIVRGQRVDCRLSVQAPG